MLPCFLHLILCAALIVRLFRSRSIQLYQQTFPQHTMLHFGKQIGTRLFYQSLRVQKFAMKTEDGELVALAAYQISSRKAYVYILYAESAPASNPVLTRKAERKYCGIGAALIAFGIKFSIDNGCRGDVVFDAKTDELAKHYAEDFGAKRIPSAASGGPKRFMLADEDAWLLFSKYLVEEEQEHG